MMDTGPAASGCWAGIGAAAAPRPFKGQVENQGRARSPTHVTTPGGGCQVRRKPPGATSRVGCRVGLRPWGPESRKLLP